MLRWTRALCALLQVLHDLQDLHDLHDLQDLHDLHDLHDLLIAGSGGREAKEQLTHSIVRVKGWSAEQQHSNKNNTAG
jgi:hypothetical protein